MNVRQKNWFRKSKKNKTYKIVIDGFLSCFAVTFLKLGLFEGMGDVQGTCVEATVLVAIVAVVATVVVIVVVVVIMIVMMVVWRGRIAVMTTVRAEAVWAASRRHQPVTIRVAFWWVCVIIPTKAGEKNCSLLLIFSLKERKMKKDRNLTLEDKLV